MVRVAALEAHTVQLGKYVKQQQSAMPAFAESLERLLREVLALLQVLRKTTHKNTHVGFEMTLGSSNGDTCQYCSDNSLVRMNFHEV